MEKLLKWQKEVLKDIMYKTFKDFTQKQWEAYIKSVIKCDTKALRRSLEIIYNNEMKSRQYQEVTGHRIGDTGFTRYDQHHVLPLVEKVLFGDPRLVPAEIDILKHSMPKYWRQIMKVAKRKIKEHETKKPQLLNAEIQEEHFGYNCDIVVHDEFEITCDECTYGICDECKK